MRWKTKNINKSTVSWNGKEIANMSFCDDVRKQNLGLGKLSISKKKKVNPIKVVNCNINAANCYVLTMIQYVHCLRNINNQSTAICRQIIRVDIEAKYFCDYIIYHHPTSVCIFLQIQYTKPSMELVWKNRRNSSIPFLKSSIPFHLATRS